MGPAYIKEELLEPAKSLKEYTFRRQIALSHDEFHAVNFTMQVVFISFEDIELETAHELGDRSSQIYQTMILISQTNCISTNQ